MVSVTSEALAGRSFQGATQRSSRPDPASQAGNDGFAALVDSNTASAKDNRYDSQPAPSRRSDDPPSTTDARPRDTGPVPDRTSRDSGSSRDDNKVDSDAPSKTKSKSKSKSDDSTSSSDAKSTGDKPDATQAAAQQDPGAATVNAVIAPVAATPATAPTPAATAPSDQPAAPLAIAAAAIAASSAIAGTGATGGSGAPAGADTAAAAATTANADKVAKAAGVKTDAQIITPGDAATASGAATATGDATFAATIAAGTPATKTTMQAKTQVAAKDATATMPADQDGAAAGSANTAQAAPTNIVPAAAQPAAVAGKAKAAADGAADAIKADASGDGNAAPTPAAGGHAAAQTQLTPPDPSAQAANALQPQPATIQTTPSATAQLTVTNAAQSAAVPLSGLAMQIAASAKSGKSRFEIRLDPAELGRIDVRIDVDRNGQVTSHLTVERPETLSMLRQDANQLQRALDNAGLSTGNGGLQFSLRDQSQSGQNNNGQPNPNAHRLIVAEEDSVPAAAAGRSYGRATGALGGVDIRV
ncbi:flagellar hook-length control protein FliK [Bradyrhizobium elkanii]|uniref:flagellar hook-length control protein FliK n=1 Tax=Bradyrhizobium elkanii TaxID=29448 RepID=UPI001BA66F84|nr:flagellar hook-length control protein FliK [Bradyrhizobium elkanii]